MTTSLERPWGSIDLSNPNVCVIAGLSPARASSHKGESDERLPPFAAAIQALRAYGEPGGAATALDDRGASVENSRLEELSVFGQQLRSAAKTKPNRA